MTFGTKYEYNPVPNKLGILLVARPNTGKTTLASRMLKNGKFGVVIDADGRFDEVVDKGLNFVPLSDEPSYMLDPKKINDVCHESMPNSEVGLFVVDSVTAILEPIILQIQRDVEEGKSKGARGYKAKSDAMKHLQAAITPWGVDTIWIYHYRDRGDAFGKMEQTTSVTELELARLYRNINLKLEIEVDKDGKRGVKVLEARRGRSGMTLWDDSGNWDNIRERLESEVWGGLTKQDQDEIEKDTNFSSIEQLLDWAVSTEAYNVVSGREIEEDARYNVAKASYEKLKKELHTEMANDLTAEIMFEAFKQKVLGKLED